MMRRRGRRFNIDHWNTSFEITASELVRKIALGPLGSNFAEEVRDDLHQVPLWRRRLVEVGRQNAALIESVAAVTGASVFVDASEPTRLRFLRKYCAL